MGRRGRGYAAIGIASALIVASAVVGVRTALAAFVDNTVVAGSTFGAAPDWVAPLVSTTTIAKTVGYLPGSIRQSGTYFVYANVTDSGNPASGVAVGGENANVTAITPAGSAVTLVAGSFPVGGTTYNHRSASLVATTPLSAGSKQYSVTSLDVAGNSRTQSGYTAIVDNAAPTASGIQAGNVGGGTIGKAEIGDTITFTFSEQIDPESILSGWTGAATNTVVRLSDGFCTVFLVCGTDSVTVWNAANTVQLRLGSVDLGRNDYIGPPVALGTRPDITFGATGTASTMVQSGSTITVTLGTAAGGGTAQTVGGNGTSEWTPSILAYDAAGNTASSASASESGSADKEF
jgi:hypothetical protein